MTKLESLERVLGKCEEVTSFLGHRFWLWKNITHRKAMNKLLKNGFRQCPNPGYIGDGNNPEFIISKRVGRRNKTVFMVEKED